MTHYTERCTTRHTSIPRQQEPIKRHTIHENTHQLETICTATSVFPVPGGPTTMVSPGYMAERMASACTGVNRMRLVLGWSCSERWVRVGKEIRVGLGWSYES